MSHGTIYDKLETFFFFFFFQSFSFVSFYHVLISTHQESQGSLRVAIAIGLISAMHCMLSLNIARAY